MEQISANKSDGVLHSMAEIQAIDRTPREVLAHYPAPIAAASWVPLGNLGGFSGARLWRGAADDGQSYCLRAWPPGRMSPQRLQFIHAALFACPLLITPKLAPTNRGATWVNAAGQFWEISTWLSGTADFERQPSDARLAAAMKALAQIHRCWAPTAPQFKPCPVAGRMIAALSDWRQLVHSGWKPDLAMPRAEGIRERIARAWQALMSMAGVDSELIGWVERPLPVQTCLCDVWHDHILYEGDAVTGVIDFGAVKPDCVAIDLARLLGSLIPDQPERMQWALAIYGTENPVPEEVLRLAPILDRVGAVIGLCNWVRWLCHEKRNYPDWKAVERRMDAFLRRFGITYQ